MKPGSSRSKFKMSKGARKQMYNSKKKNWQIIDEEIHTLKEKSTQVQYRKRGIPIFHARLGVDTVHLFMPCHGLFTDMIEASINRKQEVSTGKGPYS